MAKKPPKSLKNTTLLMNENGKQLGLNGLKQWSPTFFLPFYYKNNNKT